MSVPKLKVLISGASIARPCLAYRLAGTRLDVSITITERSPTPRVNGQTINIRDQAVEIVKAMKLEEATFAQFNGGGTFTAEYEILRADLSQLFLEATEGLANVQYIYGDSVKSLEQTEENVNVTFNGGSQATFDLVLQTGLLPNSIDDCVSIMLRPHRNTSTMGAYLCVTMSAHGQRDPVIEDAMEEGTEAQKRILREHFENTGWEAKRVKLPKWTKGRALVLGDAAFATFGVGTSLAIECLHVGGKALEDTEQQGCATGSRETRRGLSPVVCQDGRSLTWLSIDCVPIDCLGPSVKRLCAVVCEQVKAVQAFPR
ncbi:related to salicylate 1-monooxygenase [Phialocephala subalpina]|uniref:Related to salicylate 1-monooxygenase n=1 Tax=Phialocephala subalpina TaxID=576137 RepID=A0A1L7XGN3_9HELO|nr:related to salicylate 1-monooxygenase [Phialocephala subalpina]